MHDSAELLAEFERLHVAPTAGRTLIVGSKLFSEREDRRKRYPDVLGVDMQAGDGVVRLAWLLPLLQLLLILQPLFRYLKSHEIHVQLPDLHLHLHVMQIVNLLVALVPSSLPDPCEHEFRGHHMNRKLWRRLR